MRMIRGLRRENGSDREGIMKLNLGIYMQWLWCSHHGRGVNEGKQSFSGGARSRVRGSIFSSTVTGRAGSRPRLAFVRTRQIVLRHAGVLGH